MSNQQLEPCPTCKVAIPSDLIAFKWAETLSTGEQSVLLASSLKRLQGMIDAATASLAAPKKEESHRCPNCGRRMQSDFDPDVGRWYECAECDYREAVSHAQNIASDPSQQIKEAANAAATEICDYCGIDTNDSERVAEIIQRICFSDVDKKGHNEDDSH